MNPSEPSGGLRETIDANEISRIIGTAAAVRTRIVTPARLIEAESVQHATPGSDELAAPDLFSLERVRDLACAVTAAPDGQDWREWRVIFLRDGER